MNPACHFSFFICLSLFFPSFSSRSHLSSPGHVELTYFCSWSEVEESYDRKAIANMYCAPGETHTHTPCKYRPVPPC